ncbi:ribonuclease Z [Cronobacter sakazakii]
MELTFLGTSAGLPSTTRNVTAIVLNPQNNRSGLWLFDCGEGTQHQMLRATATPGKIEKIFITHLHGDHIFGLPGLLCSRSMAGCETPLEIYGPKGIAEFVETTLRLSGSWTSYPLNVHEITEGRLLDDGELTVTAYPLTHPVECYGYRIEEQDKPGALDAARLKAAGVMPGPLFQQLKRGETVTLADGRTVCGADYLSAPRPGKKIAIFGDTGPTPQAVTLARDVDVMVHETTLEAAMAEKANGRGHSTTQQAAEVAREAGAKRLLMTHFSSRYSTEDCQRLLAECQAIFPASELAEDFLTITV